MKNNKKFIIRKLRSFGRSIYNKKKGLVLGKKPIELLKLFAFLVIIYVLIALLFVAQYYLISYVFIGNFMNHVMPSTSEIISLKPGLITAVGSVQSFSNYKCSLSSHQNMIKQINKLMEIYKAVHTKRSCALKYDSSLSNQICGMDLQTLGPKCSNSPYGLGTKSFCIYIRLTKLTRFNPPGTSSNDYINIECKQKNVKLTTNPAGFLRNMLPYKGVGDLQPLIAVVVDATSDASVQCVLKAKDVPVSSSFAPSVAAGVIEIPVKKDPNHGC